MVKWASTLLCEPIEVGPIAGPVVGPVAEAQGEAHGGGWYVSSHRAVWVKSPRTHSTRVIKFKEIR